MRPRMLILLFLAGCVSKSGHERELAERDQQIAELRTQLETAKREDQVYRNGVAEVLKKCQAASAPSAAPASATPTPTGAIPLVGVHEIMRAFDENEVAASARFNTHIRITGRIRSIEQKLGGRQVVVFGSKSFGWKVVCRFAEDHYKDLLVLKKGGLEIVECDSVRLGLVKSAIFENCKLNDVAHIGDMYPDLLKKKPDGRYTLLGAIRAETGD